MNVCKKYRVEHLHLGIKFLDWAELAGSNNQQDAT